MPVAGAAMARVLDDDDDAADNLLGGGRDDPDTFAAVIAPPGSKMVGWQIGRQQCTTSPHNCESVVARARRRCPTTYLRQMPSQTAAE